MSRAFERGNRKRIPLMGGVCHLVGSQICAGMKR
jgi:hypothetical protein